MTLYCHIDGLFVEDVGEQLFAELVRTHPEGIRGSHGHAFRAILPTTDERAQTLLKCLAQAGYKPWVDRTRSIDRSREFSLQYRRQYDEADLEQCDYLELRPPPEAHVHDAAQRDSAGRIQLLSGESPEWHRLSHVEPAAAASIRKEYLKESVDFSFTMPSSYIVPDRVKGILETGQFQHSRFRPTALVSGLVATAGSIAISWEEYGAPWWELDSAFTMPPLSDSMTFTDMRGNVLKEHNFSNGFHRREGLYLQPELHYRASDIMGLEQFDLARTFEPFGNRKGYDRNDCPLVASKRFYRFCVENDLKTNWVPVRIDPT